MPNNQLGLDEDLCGARCRTGRPCVKPPMSGRSRCELHGGKTRVGFGVKGAKLGKFSKHLPKSIVSHYEEYLHDSDALSQMDDLAVLDSRLGMLFSQMDTGEAGAIWKMLLKNINELEEAIYRGDSTNFLSIVRAIRNLTNKGQTQSLLWDEIGKTFDRKQRIVESERKRVTEERQTIAVEEVLQLSADVIEIFRRAVLENCRDEEISLSILAEASSGISQLLPTEHSSGIESAAPVRALPSVPAQSLGLRQGSVEIEAYESAD